MAKPQIPSIVVQNGSASPPGSPSNKELPSPPTLSKQTSVGEEEEDGENGGLGQQQQQQQRGEFVSPSTSSPLPVTPPSPSPSPSATPCGSPLRPRRRSLTPSRSSGGGGGEAANKKSLVSSSPLPQGPGPGGGVEGSGGGETMAVGRSDPSSEGVFGSPASRSKSLELPRQRSSDSDCNKEPPTAHRSLGQRNFHSSKLKLLVRSHAMQEDTSPPPDVLEPCGPISYGPGSQMPPGLTICQSPMGCPMGGGGPPRRRLRHQGSSQGSFDGSSPCLSRDSSMEYTDSTGVDLLPFIIQTLHKNQKDRMLLLKIERELVNMVRDPKRTYHKFPHMSSYQRMLVHRVAAYFGMEHNVDQVGTCVIVNKTRNTRLPETRFREHIRDELLPPDEPKRSILRRGFSSFEEESSYKSPDRMQGLDSRRSKSFEEREEEYEKSFSLEGIGGDSPRRFHDHFLHIPKRALHEDSRWHLPPDPETHRKHYDNHRIRPSRLPKGESLESHDSLNPRSLRPPVFKSHSFGGYSGGVTVLSRGNSVASNPASGLTKQDSTGSRFSDHSSSSGYKTQRQDTSSTNVSNTLSTTPSPTAGQYYHPSFGQGSFWGAEGESHPVMWAVTDVEAVPSGALLINPHSGQPYTNPDGSVYRYDPSNPPPFLKSPPSIQHKMFAKDKEDPKLYDSNAGSEEQEERLGKGPHSSDTCGDSHNSSCSNSSSKHPSQQKNTEEEPQKFFDPPHSLDKRGYISQESVTEVGNQLRHLNLSVSSNVNEGPDASHSSVGTPLLQQTAYVIPRHQYPSTVYYMPAASIQNLSGGGIKYMYPTQYPPSAGGGQTHPPPSTSVTGATLPPHVPPPALNSLPGMAQTLSGGPGPPPPPGAQSAGAAGDASAHLPHGFVPNNYALVAYPPNGLLGPGSSSGAGGNAIPPPPPPPPPPPHESGGTTYYCQIAGPAAIAPPTAPPSATNPPGGGAAGGSAPAVSLPGNPASSATTAFPVALSYYTGSGVSNNGLYPGPASVQGFPGAMYGAPQSHTGVGAHPPLPPIQGAITYRAPTPPHTPSTQGVNVPLGFNSAGAPAGGQLIAVLPHPPPPPQPPTPTTQASHIFPTFFRPPVQIMSGSTGTPPPQPVLQYGGVSGALPAPYPPVFAKPYIGTSMHHPLIPGVGGSGESAQGSASSGLGKEESKRYVGNVGGAFAHQSGGPPPPPAAPTAHLLPRPYTFMQNDLARGGPGSFRAATPFLISGPRPRHILASAGGPFNPLTLARQSKIRKQKSRNMGYSRSTENSYSFERSNPRDKL